MLRERARVGYQEPEGEDRRGRCKLKEILTRLNEKNMANYGPNLATSSN